MLARRQAGPKKASIVRLPYVVAKALAEARDAWLKNGDAADLRHRLERLLRRNLRGGQ